MDISNVGSGVFTALPERTPVKGPGPAAAPEAAKAAEDERNLGLEILRRDIRAAMRARLSLSFDGRGYAASLASVERVSQEALLAARVILDDAPLEAAGDLRRLREGIERSGLEARELAGPEQRPAVDEALDDVRTGLDALQADADRNRVSGTSVLSAESVEKQRARIRIRTQDGDVVTLRFRQRETLSAESRSDASGSSLSVEASSRSRFSLQVRGELDAAELDAIRAVFSQAEEIADEFFGGDLSSAFAKASDFEFDQAELAKVKLGFRSRVSTSVRIAETVPYPIYEPATPLAQPAEPAAAVPREPAPAERQVDAETPVAPAVSETTPEAVSEPVAAEPEPADAIDQFVVQIRDFLRSTFEGVEKADGQRYFYSETFKLSLLRTVIETSAPEDDDLAATRANAVVDALAASSDDRDDD